MPLDRPAIILEIINNENVYDIDHNPYDNSTPNCRGKRQNNSIYKLQYSIAD